jgi:predicted  nucleic acid-binding Zn-ribbon protein
MNPDLEKLIALQEADREIERLNQEIALLPRRVAAIESKLADTRARIEKAKAAIAAAQKDRKKLETEIQDHQQKVSKYRDQSLGVKTNEQYKALLQEITFAEQAIRACEDKILDGMLAIETQEKNLKAGEAELKQETAEIEKEKSEARARTEEDQKQLAEWSARRNILRAEISADVVPYYDRVVKLRKSGIAEVREDSKCGACNVMLRPQTFNEVRANDRVIACDSCGRILYYVPPPEPEPAPGPAPAEASQPAAESAS